MEDDVCVDHNLSGRYINSTGRRNLVAIDFISFAPSKASNRNESVTKFVV